MLFAANNAAGPRQTSPSLGSGTGNAPAYPASLRQARRLREVADEAKQACTQSPDDKRSACNTQREMEREMTALGIPMTSGDPARHAVSQLIQHKLVQPRFQPIIDLTRGQITGCEALTRPDASSGFSNPAELFAAAERLGMLWQLEQVTRAASLHAAPNLPVEVQLFINTTPQVFADGRFADTMLENVRRTPGLSPSRIVLEVTEHSTQQHIEGLEEQVRLVRAYGFQVALDDVGAGTSGLNRIMALRPDWLKLDRELIGGIDHDPVRQNLIRFFVHFARLSGVKMIAEGIETQNELAKLIELGVQYAQGFYIAKPGDASQSLRPELLEWLHARSNARATEDEATPALAPYCRPARVLPGQLTVIEAAQELIEHPESSGCVVSDQSRPIGWCHRGDVLAASQDERGFASLITIGDTRAICIDAATPLADAIDIMAASKDRVFGESSPLIVQRAGEVVGVVTRADLLRAASDALKGGQQMPPTLPTLPGRIRTEEHITRLLRFGAGSSHAGQAEVAFVDLRGFADYNAHHGYGLGDEVLARLGAMLDHHVVRNESGIFLGHHGGDVFILTAPPGVLASRLRTVVDIFDRSFGSVINETSGAAQPLSLRCLVLHNVIQVAHSPRWLHRQHELLRLSEDSPRCRPQHSTISVVDASLLARRASA